MKPVTSLLLGVGIGVAIAFVFAPGREDCDEQEEWDIVDEASWESFPASDPPGY